MPSQGGKSTKRFVSRKEKRKNERTEKKKRKAVAFSSKFASSISSRQRSNKFETGLLNVGKKNNKEEASRRRDNQNVISDNGDLQAKKKQKRLNKKQEEYLRIHNSITNSTEEDPEDMEIRRLEKLLGIKGDKKKAAAKLDKEYEMFEGIGGNFGSFLMNLDSVGKRNVSEVDGNDDDESDPEESTQVVPFLNDSEHEVSDIEYTDDENEESGDDYHEYDSRHEYDDNDNNIDDAAAADNDDDDDDDDSSGDEIEYSEEDYDDGKDDEDEDDEESNGNEEGEDEESLPEDTYLNRAAPGEDIYGRKLDPSANDATKRKYIPPGMRKRDNVEGNDNVDSVEGSSDDFIDNSSEKVILVRRTMNGLLNRLSEQTKDPTIRAVKALYDVNSSTVVTHILKDNVISVCANPTQVMTSLIPLYAALVAGLHFVLGQDIGASVIESVTMKLHENLISSRENSSNDETRQTHEFIGDKVPINLMLILIYFYNFRVLHHGMVIDIMSSITSSAGSVGISDVEIELLSTAIDHCGSSLRSDDPMGLKNIISSLDKYNLSEASSHKNSARATYFMDAVTDLKNNKSRRVQNTIGDLVKSYRKWLGGIKSSLGTKKGDLCLRIRLSDVLQIETKGRWWKAGASWQGYGNISGNAMSTLSGKIKSDTDTRHGDSLSAGVHSSNIEADQALMALAKNLNMNTETRRDIFYVIMNSYDINDAYERLLRLDLRGRSDREIIRVIAECCSGEKKYNPFYAELAALLCSENRQYKTTMQYTFWDTFKVLDNPTTSNDKQVAKTTRKAINMARMLAQMVIKFHIPISILKPIDFGEVSSYMLLFLATFFIALFQEPTSDETFQVAIDRLASSADFSSVREGILIFLRSHLKAIPEGMSKEDKKRVGKRKKMTIKTMEQMSILEMVRDDERDGVVKNSHSKKNDKMRNYEDVEDPTDVFGRVRLLGNDD